MIEGHSRPVTTAHARRCSRCNRELIIISILQVAALNNICCRLDLHMYKGQRNTSVRASTNTTYKQQTTLCRVVRCGLKITYTVIKQLVIFVLCVDEIFLFDFQIVYLAHSLAAAASKCQYISYNIANLAEPWSA